MSNKIRNIDGKKYYGKIDITSPSENEDFEFDKYQPNSEKPNDIEDFYFYIKNNNLNHSKNDNVKLNYSEIKGKLLDHFRKKIDAEIEKLSVYSKYYKDKENPTTDKYAKYSHTSTMPSTSKKSNSKSNEYDKQIRKLAQIYSDLENSINSANGDTIVSLYEKYVDPDFSNYVDNKKESESMHNAYIYGQRESLEDPDERYKPINSGTPYNEPRDKDVKKPEPFNGDPKFHEKEESEQKSNNAYKRNLNKELYEDPKSWLERHPEVEDQEERFKYLR